jgi:hypothetical protein
MAAREASEGSAAADPAAPAPDPVAILDAILVRYHAAAIEDAAVVANAAIEDAAAVADAAVEDAVVADAAVAFQVAFQGYSLDTSQHHHPYLPALPAVEAEEGSGVLVEHKEAATKLQSVLRAKSARGLLVQQLSAQVLTVQPRKMRTYHTHVPHVPMPCTQHMH